MSVTVEIDDVTVYAIREALPKLGRDIEFFRRNIEANRRGPYADREFHVRWREEAEAQLDALLIVRRALRQVTELADMLGAPA